jgi:DnaJ-class molecular chaperone
MKTQTPAYQIIPADGERNFTREELNSNAKKRAEKRAQIARRTSDCRVCGGDGWLDETPTGMNATGNNDCPYCQGTGTEK